MRDKEGGLAADEGGVADDGGGGGPGEVRFTSPDVEGLATSCFNVPFFAERFDDFFRPLAQPSAFGLVCGL